MGVRHPRLFLRSDEMPSKRKRYDLRRLARLFRPICENYLATEMPTPEEVRCAPQVPAEQDCFGR
jgi:hypothetical protein